MFQPINKKLTIDYQPNKQLTLEYGNYNLYKNTKWLGWRFRPHLTGLLGFVLFLCFPFYFPSDYLTIILALILMILFIIFIENLNLEKSYYKETFTKSSLIQQRGEAINVVKLDKTFNLVIVQDIKDSNHYWLEIENPKVFEVPIFDSTRQKKKLIIEALIELYNLKYQETVIVQIHGMEVKKIIYE